MFNKFSQRDGLVFVMNTRPRPVYQSIFDIDGDCVKSTIKYWRCQRFLLFKNRLDKLSLTTTQFEIAHEDIKLPLNEDKYLQNNDGYELVTKLDTIQAEHNGVSYPIWCFIGADCDKTLDNAQLKFVSKINEFTANVQIVSHIYEENRKDQLKSYEILPDGTRKF